MNLLLDPLPNTVTVAGGEYAIRSEFYIGIQFELLMQEPGISDEQKVLQALELYYPEIPPDLNGAVDSLLWFYRCGRPAPAGQGGGRVRRCYDFEQDAPLIYSAFYGAYGIDLNRVEDLHWWSFRALFQGLPADCELCRVMGYRTMDTSGMSKRQREFYAKMKRLHALKTERTADQSMSLAARDRRMMEHVRRRYQEAGL